MKGCIQCHPAKDSAWIDGLGVFLIAAAVPFFFGLSSSQIAHVVNQNCSLCRLDTMQICAPPLVIFGCGCTAKMQRLLSIAVGRL